MVAHPIVLDPGSLEKVASVLIKTRVYIRLLLHGIISYPWHLHGIIAFRISKRRFNSLLLVSNVGTVTDLETEQTLFIYSFITNKIASLQLTGK